MANSTKCPVCNSVMEAVRIETLADVADDEFMEVYYCKKCKQETWIPYKFTECE